MSDEFDSPRLYTLTGYTGSEARARRVRTLGTFTARRGTWIGLGAGTAGLIVVSALLWPLLAEPSLIVGGAVGAAAYAAVTVRSRGGMQQVLWRSILTKHRSSAGAFYIGGQQVDPDMCEGGVIVVSTAPRGAGGGQGLPVAGTDIIGGRLR